MPRGSQAEDALHIRRLNKHRALSGSLRSVDLEMWRGSSDARYVKWRRKSADRYWEKVGSKHIFLPPDFHRNVNNPILKLLTRIVLRKLKKKYIMLVEGAGGRRGGGGETG